MLSRKQLKRQKKKERDRNKLISESPTPHGEQQAIKGSQKRKLDEDSAWNFEVEYNDHFETPKIAYMDLIPVLLQAARDCNKTLSDLVVYDPYYCAGQMVNFLHELGVTNVINRNRDFYADVAEQNIPEHDILVTNPPYSGEHKQKLLQYLSQSDKPFCLLLPVYVATKSYWREFVASEKVKKEGKSSTSSKTGISPQLTELYLLPSISYEYNHPEGTGKDIPPFFSSWFIGGGFQSLLAVRNAILSPEHNLDRCLSVCISVESLIKKGVVGADSAKRPNPKQRRKKMKSSNNSNGNTCSNGDGDVKRKK
mmetsp:Transcript_15749/g.26291  ORF Transcript_15749/g.26291 Transcript_15749/m.26291 type:complete len:310 (+) Transcript_15749:81-1010(+)